MQYQIEFDAISRKMVNKGLSAVTHKDIHYDVIEFTYIDSDGLLEGYDSYCVFDSAIKRKVIDGLVEIPADVLIGDRIRIQLMFCKENKRFYSLNILTFKLNKVIS